MDTQMSTRQSLTFLLVLLVVCLVGCGGGEQGPNADTEVTASPAETPTSSPVNGQTVVDNEASDTPSDQTDAPSDPIDFADLQLSEVGPVPSIDGGESAEDLVRQRLDLDRTVWAPEVRAQRYEEAFVRLWDDLRTHDDEYLVVREFPFRTLTIPAAAAARDLELGIRVVELSGASQSYSPKQWHARLASFQESGYEIVQTEWHHAEFRSAQTSAPSSVVNFVIDLQRRKPAQRVSIRGKLDVLWDELASGDDMPRPKTISVRDARILYRDSGPAFREIFKATTYRHHKRLMPLLLYDLNGDGLSEILLGGLNHIYWNEGGGNFRQSLIAADGLDIFDAAVLGDFDGDSQVDMVCVGTTRQPLLLRGTHDGFEAAPTPCSKTTFELPKSFTCGDIDGDGDLDLWIGQYKFPYVGGAMPTPFYDANDGYPSALLLNDGQGQFTDVTVERGLAAKRTRRTFSSSLVDLDDDGDLDLMTVNDFAGVDVYQNDGRGFFVDVTSAWLDQRHLFGMGHTFGDYNLDGRGDMYLIGMSSTTARRLEVMGLARADHLNINRMRMAMGYGNRMLLGQGGVGRWRFKQAPFNDQVCRTGWSWGTTSFDVENDGDADIFVVNGHNSGRSARDYCTRYWCHDVYTGTSQASPELHKLFADSLKELHRGEISWNGFEHNVLWLNAGGRAFTNVAFLLGVGSEFDSRAAASEDIDGDGRPDLLVVEYRSDRLGHAEYVLHVFRNEIADRGHWIGLRLEESTYGRSPVGAKVTVRTKAGTMTKQIVNGDSFSTQHAPVAHFGLGQLDSVESLDVIWPDGEAREFETPQLDRYYPE